MSRQRVIPVYLHEVYLFNIKVKQLKVAPSS